MYFLVNVTFDVILFDRRAAIGRFLDVGTVALFVDDAPACENNKTIFVPFLFSILFKLCD